MAGLVRLAGRLGVAGLIRLAGRIGVARRLGVAGLNRLAGRLGVARLLGRLGVVILAVVLPAGSGSQAARQQHAAGSKGLQQQGLVRRAMRGE
jgi:hypothetical protein